MGKGEGERGGDKVKFQKMCGERGGKEGGKKRQKLNA